MKNLIVGLLIGAVLGSIAGFAVGISYAPYLYPSPELNELLDDARSRTQVAVGAFVHPDPSDPMHYGSGGVTLYEGLVHLEQDFEVGPGPKFHVYLAPDADITPDTRVEETMFVDLGPLRAFSGSQSYPIPAGTDQGDYKSVVIWSEHFNLLISAARLRFSPAADVGG